MILLAAVLGAVGCGRQAGPLVRIVHDERPPLEFGVSPFLEREALLDNMGPLVRYLARGLGRKVELRIGPSYADMDRLMRQRRLELAWYRPPEGSSLAAKLAVVCRPKYAGGHPHRGVIVARRREGVEVSLAALAGRRFVYVDRSSNSGFVYPNRLFASRGIDPLRYFSSVMFAGSHDRVVEQVIDGTADAGAVSDVVVQDPKQRERLGRELVVVAATEPIPPDPLVVPSEMEPGLRQKLRDLFVSMPAAPDGRATLERLSASLGVTGFE